jgi:hypothetical protein
VTHYTAGDAKVWRLQKCNLYKSLYAGVRAVVDKNYSRLESGQPSWRTDRGERAEAEEKVYQIPQEPVAVQG